MSSSQRFLVDTNVISERQKGKPDSRVTQFLLECDEANLLTSVLVLGELRRGAVMQNDRNPYRAYALHSWIDLVERDFEDRILGIDLETARVWSHITAGRSRPIVDSLLAATAIQHGLALLTRNVRDVDDLDLVVGSPWKSVRAS